MKDIIKRFWEIRSFKPIHFIKNPLIGGSPPIDRNLKIKISSFIDFRESRLMLVEEQ
jgi:hypothetical protein